MSGCELTSNDQRPWNRHLRPSSKRIWQDSCLCAPDPLRVSDHRTSISSASKHNFKLPQGLNHLTSENRHIRAKCDSHVSFLFTLRTFLSGFFPCNLLNSATIHFSIDLPRTRPIFAQVERETFQEKVKVKWLLHFFSDWIEAQSPWVFRKWRQTGLCASPVDGSFCAGAAWINQISQKSSSKEMLKLRQNSFQTKRHQIGSSAKRFGIH